MRFGILGPTQVFTDGGQVRVGGPRLRALLAALLLDAGQLVSAERLIDDLYGEAPPSDAANALQSQVSRLRHLLLDQDRAGPLVEFHPAGYRLAVDPADVDAHQFGRLVADGQRALAAGDQSRAVAVLREALELWRGPALADVGDAPFAPVRAARLAELRMTAVESRVEAELALGEHGRLVGELQELVAAHPLRERLRGQLMRALYGSGRQAEALAAFAAARRILADELGIEPSAELAAVHLAVLRADPSLVANRPTTMRHGLPAQLTTFLGREEELERAAKLLGEARLVTLTGPGGAGKTRLAIEAANRQSGDVFFVELAPLVGAAELPLAVLAALGLREGGLLTTAGPERRAAPPDSTVRLIAALSDRPTLLVLDNCEHVVQAAAELADRLLGACPALRILATSREVLGITGEALCPVPPLRLPPPSATALEVLGYPAVRLFADRAAAVRPDFAVDATNADEVVRICQALDGLPLAIELAAARLRSMTLAAVSARLDDRFRLLSRGNRAAQPRHQTLRAVVGWSWDLLDHAEQMLARRLTVFSGGATLEAAERVCGTPAVDVLEVLTSLADKSLIEAPSEDGQRYRMLETVRAFCAERLDDAGERDALRRTHLAYYLDLAETADPHLRRAEQLEWLQRLDVERDNLHAALRCAVDIADRLAALQLLAALSSYWWLRGLRSEAAALAREVLEMAGPEPPPGLEEEYALCVMNFAANEVHGPELLERIRTAESIVLSLDRPPKQPFLNVLWAVTVGPPTEDAADQLTRRQQLIGHDPWNQALSRYGWGLVRLFNGEAAIAEDDLAAALDGFREVGERWGMAMTLTELAALADWRGDRARSGALTEEALELAGLLDSPDDMADLLRQRAGRSVRAGELASAEADFERAAELARRGGASEKLAGAHHGLGEIARLRGDLGEARRRYEEALAECPTGWYGGEEMRSQILVALGRIAEAEGDAAAARAWHRQALATTPISGVTAAAGAAEGLAGVALLEGDNAEAALLLGMARALRGASVAGQPDVARISASARARLGDDQYESAYQRGAAMTRDQALTALDAPRSAPGA